MSDEREREKTPWLELAIGGLGALVLALMLGFLVHDAFGDGEDAPVDIALERGEFAELDAGWRVPVTVRNLGDRPAEAVELRAELELPSGEVEEAALVLDFLAPRGSVEAAFLFDQDPDGAELRLRAVGYLVP